MSELHHVIAHLRDGECSTEGKFKDRAEEIQFAESIADRIFQGEWVYVLGYTIRGRKQV